MVHRVVRKLTTRWIAVACTSASLLAGGDGAHAAEALFRVKRTWWFGFTDSWTNGYVTPRTSAKSYAPPAVAYVGRTAGNPRFTAPKSFIKNTTYYFSQCAASSYYCYSPDTASKAWYSYWNARGSFRPQNPRAPTETTTVRLATTMSSPPTPRNPHTAMYEPVTPTTTWGGRYDHSRAGSIMIWPGKNRFGGTMRFFEGPNSRYFDLNTDRYGPDSSITIRAKPLSQQLGTGVEIEIGEVTEATVAFRYRLTEPYYIDRRIIGTTWPSGPQYDVRIAHYLVTRAPYTTGMVRAWEPLGNTNTIQTATGYDNRTQAGLIGTISMVHPRLVHAYTEIPASGGAQIKMTWSSARMRKIDFRFLPEPSGIALLGLATLALAGLNRLRHRGRGIWNALGLALGVAPLGVALGVAEAQVIETIVGGGPNDVPALSANLGSSSAVAVDGDGNLFIAAVDDREIYKVDSSGWLTVVAGGGYAAAVGDGGPAINAWFARPSGVALDAAGNLFIADPFGGRVRRVDGATGIITTVGAFEHPAGVVFDATGALFVADGLTHLIWRIDAASGETTVIAGNGNAGYSGDGGPATAASLRHPVSTAVDAAGNLFIADQWNQRVRRVDGATGIITTVAGTGSFGFSGDGGLATAAELYSPTAVALDAAGHLLIADRVNGRIRRVDVATGIITTIAGDGAYGATGDGGPATAASLSLPSGIAVDRDGNLLIADQSGGIRRVDRVTGMIDTVAGNAALEFSGDGGPANVARLGLPAGLVLDAAGNLLIADAGDHRVRRVDAESGTISTIAGRGTPGFSGNGGAATAAQLYAPAAIALDAGENLYIADSLNNQIRRVDAATGIISTVAGSGYSRDLPRVATTAWLTQPRGVALDSRGNLFISDTGYFRVVRVDAGTRLMTIYAGGGVGGFAGDGGPATLALLHHPWGIAFDAQDNLFISDFTVNRVRRVDWVTRIITTVVGNGLGTFSGDGGLATEAGADPIAIAFDPAGNYFIADYANHRIRRVHAHSAKISTVAGNGVRGFSGDGGAATSASVAHPRGVAVDAAGNLFIADSWNRRIRRVGDRSTSISVAVDFERRDTLHRGMRVDGGMIVATIFGSAAFDVSEVDGTSLRLARKGAAPVSDLDAAAAFTEYLEDADGDGFTDLSAEIRVEELEQQFGEGIVCLSGQTLGGVHFRGCETLRADRAW